MCHQPSEQVAVHGHVQCRVCGQNVDPCCSGETACPVDTASPGGDLSLRQGPGQTD
tara:strand:- start:96 stop:263 length:168 start_codon:yes stop_codon:yes gene_type:complete